MAAIQQDRIDFDGNSAPKMDSTQQDDVFVANPCGSSSYKNKKSIGHDRPKPITCCPKTRWFQYLDQRPNIQQVRVSQK